MTGGISMGVVGGAGGSSFGATARYATSLIDRLSRAGSLGAPLAATLPAADTPTIVVGTAATITASYVSAMDTNRVTLTGTGPAYDTVNGRVGFTGTLSGLDFFHEGTAFEMNIFTALNPQPYMAFVNGVPVADTPGMAGTGGYITIKFTFPSSAKRRVEFYAPGAQAFYGMGIPNGTAVTGAPRQPRVAWIGDSFLAGSAACSTLLSAHMIASRFLACEPVVYAAAGTGYVTAGSFTTFGDPVRVSAIASQNPELIVFVGSVNDTVSGLQAAATACYNAYAAALPNAKFIVAGVQPTAAVNTTSTSYAQMNNAVYAAASVHPSVLGFIDLIGNATTGAVPSAWVAANTWAPGAAVTSGGSLWTANFGSTLGGDTPGGLFAEWSLATCALTGTGNVGSPAGDGTRDVLLYSDNIHPTVLGSRALGEYLQRGIRTILATAAAS